MGEQSILTYVSPLIISSDIVAHVGERRWMAEDESVQENNQLSQNYMSCWKSWMLSVQNFTSLQVGHDSMRRARKSLINAMVESEHDGLVQVVLSILMHLP